MGGRRGTCSGLWPRCTHVSFRMIRFTHLNFRGRNCEARDAKGRAQRLCRRHTAGASGPGHGHSKARGGKGRHDRGDDGRRTENRTNASQYMYMLLLSRQGRSIPGHRRHGPSSRVCPSNIHVVHYTIYELLTSVSIKT